MRKNQKFPVPDKGVESKVGVSIFPVTSGGVLQLQNFQITDVIFRIITGLFCDISVDCFAGPGESIPNFPRTSAT